MLIRRENLQPDWITKFHYYYDHYVGKLTRLYGLSERDVGVYMFMFTQNLFFKKSNFVPYKISSELNKIHNEYIPNQFKSKYIPRDVKESLDRLEGLGFVKKFPNNIKQTSGGAPGKFLYSSTRISELDQFTQLRLDKIREEMLNVLQDLIQVEDAVGWKVEANGSNKN